MATTGYFIKLHDARTIHNFSSAVTLVSKTDNEGEVHIESTNPYTINAADWNDGDWFDIINTSGADINTPFNVAGFAGAFLRDGTTTPIVGATNALGKQDAHHTVRITENPLNSGIKYLNIYTKAEGNMAGFVDVEIQRYKPAVADDINNTSIATGLNLNDGDTLHLQFSDAGAARQWPQAAIELPITQSGDSFFVWNYDNDYIVGTVTNMATGTITFVDSGRNAELEEAWITKHVKVTDSLVVSNQNKVEYGTGAPTGIPSDDGIDTWVDISDANYPIRYDWNGTVWVRVNNIQQVKTVTANYTTLDTDSGNIVVVNSATPVTITLSNLLNGTTTFIQQGLGAINFVSGNRTRLHVSSLFTTAGQHSVVDVTTVGTNAYLSGALS